MNRKNFKKGQSILEYAILIVVVVGALLAMQWYMKGGYQGRLRSASDDIGEQYSPTRVQTTSTATSSSTTNEVTSGGSFFTGDMPVTTSTFTQNQNRAETENLQGLEATADQR